MDNLGLTYAQAQQLLTQYGPNEIKPKKKSLIVRLFKLLISPITLMLAAAAILSFFTDRLFDGYFILALTLLNIVINVWQEKKADNAIENLQKTLAVKTKVKRDGKWVYLNANQLVPGDMVSLNVGDLVPADLNLSEATNLTINESVLTGESLPKEKKIKDTAYSGSYVATGMAIGQVTKTGAQTEFGKTLISINKATKRSLLEKDILSVSKLLAAASIIAIIFLTVVLLKDNQAFSDILRLDLSLIIAGVPVSLPTVMSIIIALGIVQLANKKVIVRNLAALENLSNVNLLLTDKTGTLTENKIEVEKIIAYQKQTEEVVIKLAVSTVKDEATKDPIEMALMSQAKNQHLIGYKIIKQIVADSNRKRTTTTIKMDNKDSLISVGAPQVIKKLLKISTTEMNRFEADINQAANQGNRALAVAISPNHKEEDMELVGLILMSDTPRADAKQTISYLNQEGILVKMLTGDNLKIGQRIAKLMGLVGEILPRTKLNDSQQINANNTWWGNKAGFAEILPKDKLYLAKQSEKNFVIAVTGDGVNDLPAIASADVGIAVNNAVDALKSSADIVILKDGISAIKDALIESRKIFERLYSYSVYRISESFRLIVTIAVLGFLIHSYPLTPIQIILIAFLNDLPILSLAYNRVKKVHRPNQSASKSRLLKGLIFGLVGIANSLFMYYVMDHILHQPLAVIQTVFFLKLTVSGHLLIYVAHTRERWYRYLPSKQVIWATGLTQIVASLIAYFGLFMAPIPFGFIIFIWIWSFLWMQVADLIKPLVPRL